MATMIKLKRFLIYLSTPQEIFSKLDHILLLNLIPFLIGWGLGVKEDLMQGLIYAILGMIICIPAWIMILINAWKSFNRGYSHDA
jgi:hypothetical protein